jgi:2-succinyl-5-enolpyruvyl-6-hydroxy-3-cyclohexene-1-carboxylate synthase
VLDQLRKVIADASQLQTRLVFVVGGSTSARAKCVRQLAQAIGAPVIALGAELGQRLLPIPKRQRSLQAPNALRELVQAMAVQGQPAILDRIEILFDRSLQLDPIDVLKRLAHGRTVVACWPGELSEGRLIYASNHPEHCDQAASGVVTFQLP